MNESLRYRPAVSDNIGQGGALSADKWFRGPVGIIGGVEWYIPKGNGLKLKLEADPFDYQDFSVNTGQDSSFRLRKKDSDINFGLSYPFKKNLTLNLSYIKGNTFNVNFSYGLTFKSSSVKKPNFKPVINTKEPDKRNNFYEDLLRNLNKNQLLLQTSEIKNKELNISVSSSTYLNHIRSSSYAAYIASDIADSYDIDINRINITNINVGIELNKISYPKKAVSDTNMPIELIVKHSNIEPGIKKNYLNNAFKPTVKFPIVFSSIAPNIISHIGSPQRVFFGGLSLKHSGEVQFSRNLILLSEINSILFDTFDKKVNSPDSFYLPHVRTDLVSYLQESNTYISRLQLDYIWSPAKNTYMKLSGGIFETMYGGLGGEILYKPFKNNFSTGINAFYVKKRAFDQKLDFLDYETITGHINFSYLFPSSGIKTKISYGRYLAKDVGFTFDISRQTRSGFKAGVFFSNTNVSAIEFGEGSFDKGFYFQIPFDLFSGRYSTDYFNFKLRPLTRDGAAKLEYGNELDGLIYNTTYNELFNGWGGFLD